MNPVAKFFLCFCTVAWLFITAGQAQTMDWDEFLNIYADNATEQGESSLERLEEMHSTPFNINECTSSDLQQLPFVNVSEADSIISYIRKNGAILSAGELFLVRGLSYDSRRMLPLFVSFEPPAPEKKSLWKRLANGQQEVAGVVHIPFYIREGFKRVVNSRTGVAQEPRYAGTPVSGSLRYRNKAGNNLQMGFTAKNDYGEPFAKDGNALFDSYSAYIVNKEENGWLRGWALGDYKMHIGKGLTAGIGFMNNGMALLASRHDHTSGFFAHTGTDEYAFLRGAAAKVSFSAVSITAFASVRQLDGRLQGDSLLSISTTGYHRLPLELERKNNVRQMAAGVSVDMQLRQFHYGVSGTYIHYDHRFELGDRLYQKNNMVGNDFANYGIHYSLEKRKLNIGGEVALTNRKQMAALHDVRWQLPVQVNLYIQHRYYGRRYHAPLAYAYSGGGKCRAEHGVMLGLQWLSYDEKWSLAGFADGYRLLGTSYKALESANGYTTQLQTVYHPSRNLQFTVRYRLRSRQESSAKHPVLRYAMKHSLRLQTDYKIGVFRCATSLDGCYFKPSFGESQKGGMIAERISFVWKKFKVAASVAAFHTQGYESSIYFYQPALLYARSYSGFYYHGCAATCTVQRPLGKHLDLACKFTTLRYTDRDTIGSGDSMIKHPGKSDISIQVRWLF